MVNFFKELKYTMSYILALCVSMLLIINVYFASMVESPISLTNNVNDNFSTFIPQGWAFFTRDPREAQILIYKIEKGIIVPVEQKHSSIYNLIGINRKASKILSELQMLIYKIDKKKFVDFKWNYQTHCYDNKIIKPIKLKNEFYKPILKGEYLIIFQKPVPWAWSKSINNLKMDAKGIKINVE